jgi:hypothetical protein
MGRQGLLFKGVFVAMGFYGNDAGFWEMTGNLGRFTGESFCDSV